MLPTSEIAAGLPAELALFAGLVRPLGSAELSVPSRCAGWTVGDVAAHVIGSLADVTAGRLEGVGTPAWTARQVDERRGRSSAELADELDGATKAATDLLAAFDAAAWASPAPAGVAGTLADGVLALWSDAWLHADDIRAALGRRSVPGPGLRAAVHHVGDVLALAGWGSATLVESDRQVRADPAEGDAVTVETVAFLLAATGRQDAATIGLEPDVNIYR